MAIFVLVHGSWQGAWCWREVVTRLEAQGHRAVPIDLPGHGADRTPPESVTLQNYTDAIVDAVRRLDEPPILVGHSLGGIVSLAAEECPERIRALVYVTAILPRDGMTLMQTVAGFDSRYLAEIVWAEDRRTARISAQGAYEFLYHLCEPTLVEEVLPLFCAEPVAPFETPIERRAERIERVPSYYIECLRDRVVPLALQREIHPAASCKNVYSIDTGHAPFFSAPDCLADILHAISQV
jgi:pimeloyl-ACP methyl ester carboxylesterase